MIGQFGMHRNQDHSSATYLTVRLNWAEEVRPLLTGMSGGGQTRK